VVLLLDAVVFRQGTDSLELLFGPENTGRQRLPTLIAVVLVLVDRGSCCYQIFKVLKLIRFSTDRN